MKLSGLKSVTVGGKTKYWFQSGGLSSTPIGAIKKYKISKGELRGYGFYKRQSEIERRRQETIAQEAYEREIKAVRGDVDKQFDVAIFGFEKRRWSPRTKTYMETTKKELIDKRTYLRGLSNEKWIKEINNLSLDSPKVNQPTRRYSKRTFDLSSRKLSGR